MNRHGICIHGSLEKKCEICERDEEIAKLTEKVRTLEGENVELKDLNIRQSFLIREFRELEFKAKILGITIN